MDDLPIADNVIPEVRRIEEQPGLLGEINRHVADGNAWLAAAGRRCVKANAALDKLNAERAKAKPPLPPIPPVRLPQLRPLIEPDPEPSSGPPPADPKPSPALSIEPPPSSAADVKATLLAFMEGKGKPKGGGR
jgi:hypothetical protein